MKSLLDKFKYSLAKTRAVIVSKFVSPQWSAEEMEKGLLAADFGPKLSGEIVAGIRKRLELNPHATTEDATNAAKAEIESIFQNCTGTACRAPTTNGDKTQLAPYVLLLVGVNGAGKTTTTAKLAKRFQADGGKVLLAAGDTFRAAAIEQLKLWGGRLNIPVVSSTYGADPGSVAHDAIKKMQSEHFTHLLIDTAGRQHTKSNLMQELQKVKRVISKSMPEAPHDTWLVVDAPTGANALAQAREFNAAMGLTGVVITKLDGTAKGGMVLAIQKELGLPIRYIGLGEDADDLESFDPTGFAEAIFSE
jgi:fused signal recognition particle receptor